MFDFLRRLYNVHITSASFDLRPRGSERLIHSILKPRAPHSVAGVNDFQCAMTTGVLGRHPRRALRRTFDIAECDDGAAEWCAIFKLDITPRSKVISAPVRVSQINEAINQLCDECCTRTPRVVEHLVDAWRARDAEIKSAWNYPQSTIKTPHKRLADDYLALLGVEQLIVSPN